MLDGGHGDVEILAANLAFTTPTELCALRALVDHAALVAEKVYFDCPVLSDTNNYLGRMDFYADLPKNVVLSHDPPTMRRIRTTKLIELYRVRAAEDVQRLEERVWPVAKDHFGAGPMAKACVEVIAAASENVIDHANSPIGALVAAQRYDGTRLEIAVIDLGLGIPTTLRRRPDFEGLTDMAAVEQSLQDGVTSTGEEGRGAGMAELIAAARRVGSSTLTIESGRAHLLISSRHGTSDIHRVAPGTPLRGTWISLRLQP